MTRKMKRTLSLILALVMLCSTMGVMAFAADDMEYEAFCSRCGEQKGLVYRFYDDSFVRMVECPLHNGLHEAEEWFRGHQYTCIDCGLYICPDGETYYVCLI